MRYIRIEFLAICLREVLQHYPYDDKYQVNDMIDKLKKHADTIPPLREMFFVLAENAEYQLLNIDNNLFRRSKYTFELADLGVNLDAYGSSNLNQVVMSAVGSSYAIDTGLNTKLEKTFLRDGKVYMQHLHQYDRILGLSEDGKNLFWSVKGPTRVQYYKNKEEVYTHVNQTQEVRFEYLGNGVFSFVPSVASTPAKTSFFKDGSEMDSINNYPNQNLGMEELKVGFTDAHNFHLIYSAKVDFFFNNLSFQINHSQSGGLDLYLNGAKLLSGKYGYSPIVVGTPINPEYYIIDYSNKPVRGSFQFTEIFIHRVMRNGKLKPLSFSEAYKVFDKWKDNPLVAIWRTNDFFDMINRSIQPFSMPGALNFLNNIFSDPLSTCSKRKPAFPSERNRNGGLEGLGFYGDNEMLAERVTGGGLIILFSKESVKKQFSDKFEELRHQSISQNPQISLQSIHFARININSLMDERKNKFTEAVAQTTSVSESDLVANENNSQKDLDQDQSLQRIDRSIQLRLAFLYKNFDFLRRFDQELSQELIQTGLFLAQNMPVLLQSSMTKIEKANALKLCFDLNILHKSFNSKFIKKLAEVIIEQDLSELASLQLSDEINFHSDRRRRLKNKSEAEIYDSKIELLGYLPRNH